MSVVCHSASDALDLVAPSVHISPGLYARTATAPALPHHDRRRAGNIAAWRRRRSTAARAWPSAVVVKHVSLCRRAAVGIAWTDRRHAPGRHTQHAFRNAASFFPFNAGAFHRAAARRISTRARHMGVRRMVHRNARQRTRCKQRVNISDFLAAWLAAISAT